MSEPRKVNWKNVCLVLLVGAIGTAVGVIDRLVNKVRPLEDVYLFLSTNIPLAATTPAGASEAAQWYNTTSSISMTMSSFNMPITIILIVVMVIVVAILSRTCCYAA